ncbi:MAG TPA: V-type ATP synthase subunit E [Coriobacteriia bacterium]
MAIEDIFRALEEQADRECRDILDGAKAQAKGIENDAKAEADKIKADKLTAADSAVGVKVGQTLNAARLANKKDIAAAKDRGVEAAYADALAELAKLRGSKEYEALFKSLTEEALAGLTSDVTLLVDPADAELAKRTLSALGVAGEVDASAKTVGGPTVVSEGGRVFRRNTLEDRMRKLRKTRQAEVAEILFG